MGGVVVGATALILALGACGSGGGSADSLEVQVEDALNTVPYEYRLLPERSTQEYVVFRVSDPDRNSVNIAFGGRSTGKRCPDAPPLPMPHREGGKPFSAAGPEPLICFDDDAWRPGSPESAAVARLNMVGKVATALCEELYDEFTCFD